MAHLGNDDSTALTTLSGGKGATLASLNASLPEIYETRRSRSEDNPIEVRKSVSKHPEPVNVSPADANFAFAKEVTNTTGTGAGERRFFSPGTIERNKAIARDVPEKAGSAKQASPIVKNTIQNKERQKHGKSRR